MFSSEYYAEIRRAFDRQMKLPEEGICQLQRDRRKEIYEIMSHCTEEESQALSFLYGAMPLSDLLDYPAALFLTYAKHGVFLWNHGPFAGSVPEKIFANYVLFHRVNNEDITETREFFYEKIKETADIRTDSLYHAAVDVNYWCAGEATYHATDDRTQNPRSMYGAAIGRCGEESTFTVTALRSMGIPARQVYAPLWSHCDDNHAWVEVWCDGSWYFLGACEPEMSLNQGWFLGPSSRAMMVHSRWFDSSEPEEAQVGRKGAVRVLNHLARYANTVQLWVKIVDEKGKPVSGAKVEFQVLNQGAFGTIAVVYTGSEPGSCGMAELTTGFGSLHISASARIASMASETGEEWLYGETQADLRCTEENDKSEYVIVVRRRPGCFEGWREFIFYAPRLKSPQWGEFPQSDAERGKLRLDEMTEHRRKKEKSFYQKEKAEKALEGFIGQDRIRAEDILRKARGNMEELVRFLEWNGSEYLPPGWEKGRTEEWKLEFLNTLREKDYWDIKADILQDCCRNALVFAGQFPDDIFFPYLMCPRVSNEMLTPCRKALSQCLDQFTKEIFRKNPERLWIMLEEKMKSLPEQEYEDLVTSPLNCLKGGVGSRHSKEILCVNLYRSLGIPSRLNPFDGRIEFYIGGKFLPVGNTVENACHLTLCEDGCLNLADWAYYSLERYEEGSFRRLWPHQKLDRLKGGRLELQLQPGIYRIIVTDRQKNGDQLAAAAVFELERGTDHEVLLSQRKIQKNEKESAIRVETFPLKTLSGENRESSSLLDCENLSDQKGLPNQKGHGNTLFLWLETGREPTEHILNELYEKREAFSKLNNQIYVVLKKREDLDNITFRKVVNVLPKICPLLDADEENVRVLAEKVGEDSGKLPFALILDYEQNCLYSSAGYNVGLADALLKVL